MLVNRGRLLHKHTFNLSRAPNDQISSNAQISVPTVEIASNPVQFLVPPVEIASNPAEIENFVPVCQVAKRLKLSCSLSQDDINLAQPLATSTSNKYNINSAHQQEISSSPIKTRVEYNIVGRRILDLAYICQQIKEKDNHDPYGCSFKDMVCVNEKKIGLKSSFAFKCDFYLKTYTVDSENPEANMTDINIAAVAGIMNVGGGFSQLQTMTASLEIPP